MPLQAYSVADAEACLDSSLMLWWDQGSFHWSSPSLWLIRAKHGGWWFWGIKSLRRRNESGTSDRNVHQANIILCWLSRWQVGGPRRGLPRFNDTKIELSPTSSLSVFSSFEAFKETWKLQSWNWHFGFKHAHRETSQSSHSLIMTVWTTSEEPQSLLAEGRKAKIKIRVQKILFVCLWFS